VEHSAQRPRQRTAPQAHTALPAGCKRILYSATTTRRGQSEGDADHRSISRITPDGIVTDDGVEHAVDVIVYATGFHTTDSYTYVDVKGPRVRTW